LVSVIPLRPGPVAAPGARGRISSMTRPRRSWRERPSGRGLRSPHPATVGATSCTACRGPCRPQPAPPSRVTCHPKVQVCAGTWHPYAPSKRTGHTGSLAYRGVGDGGLSGQIAFATKATYRLAESAAFPRIPTRYGCRGPPRPHQRSSPGPPTRTQRSGDPRCAGPDPTPTTQPHGIPSRRTRGADHWYAYEAGAHVSDPS
jgi:hypothetical protein